MISGFFLEFEGLILEAQERSGPRTMVLKEGNMEGDEARYLASYNHSRDPQVMSVIFMDFSSLRSWEGHISMRFPMVWKYVKVALKNIEYTHDIFPLNNYSEWYPSMTYLSYFHDQRWSTSFINSKLLQCDQMWPVFLVEVSKAWFRASHKGLALSSWASQGCQREKRWEKTSFTFNNCLVVTGTWLEYFPQKILGIMGYNGVFNGIFHGI